MKNRFLASLALAVVIAAPATAAELPLEAPASLPFSYYDWSGAYVGFNAGGTHHNVTHHFPSPGAITPDVTTGDHDAIFGFHAGAQSQWGAWVFGAEVARSGCVHECRSTSSGLPVSQGFEENIFGQHEADMRGSLLLRRVLALLSLFDGRPSSKSGQPSSPTT